jgi:hypothetical protein
VNNREWFLEKGLAYKITSLFYGEPGTGKTSLVKAIASHYNRSVCILDLGRMSNQSLQLAVARLPRKSLMLVEDADAASAATKRRPEKKKKLDVAEPSELSDVVPGGIGEPVTDLSAVMGLTLAGLLNALDGIIPLHDTMVMMTTNHIEKLDPALIRSGRVDYKYEIKKMGNEEINAFVAAMYPQAQLPTTVFEPMARCDVQSAFRKNPTSVQGFLKLVPHSAPAVFDFIVSDTGGTCTVQRVQI